MFKRKVVLWMMIVAPSVFAHGPTRQSIEESIDIAASPEKVWAVVGDFNGLDKWHPAVQSQTASGDATRILNLGDGKLITEVLKSLDKEKMTLKYKITDMSILETFQFAGSEVKRKVLPVDNYSSIMKVSASDNGAKVTWIGKFYRPYLLNPPTPEGMDDKAATSTMRTVYRAGLDNLKKMLEK